MAAAAVRTVIGTAQLAEARLFTFGDADGPATRARLQHPLGLAFAEGRLYVADTYNNKVKIVDPVSGAVRTLAGDGKSGRSDRPPRFDEPAGLCVAAGRLFIADTDNHLVPHHRPAKRQGGNADDRRIETLRLGPVVTAGHRLPASGANQLPALAQAAATTLERRT